MKKKLLIALSVIVFIVIAMGVLYWGLQPVTREDVTLDKLNKKLNDKYSMPSELPFEGDVECSIIYIEGHMGVVLTRFEINPKRSTGYSIKLNGSNRNIYIAADSHAGLGIGITEEYSKYLITDEYNNQTITYLFNAENGKVTENSLTIIYYIDDNMYYISAVYDKTIDIEILKSDMRHILDQMIKYQ